MLKLTIKATALALVMMVPGVANAANVPEGFVSERTETLEVNLHYVRDGGDGDTVILMHGWPQTWASWAEVMPLLSDGFDVIAVDIRGAGQSDAPESGYDKRTMAADIKGLLDELGIERAHVVGHDIGGMVAFAFASVYPEATQTVSIIDTPLPGTPIFGAIAQDPRAWHFSFHAAPDVPEALTRGREDIYYGNFMTKMDAGAGGISADEIATTVEAYGSAENARAGFEWYRAFVQDSDDNRVFSQTALDMPVLAVSAGRLAPEPYVEIMMRDLATTVVGHSLDSGHWIPETRPEELTRILAEFFETE